MNMLSHRFDVDELAVARIHLDVPLYAGTVNFSDFGAVVTFSRDETDRDGFHVEEMTVCSLSTGMPGKIVRRLNGGWSLDHELACAILKEFHTENSLRRAEEAMREAEYQG